ncbi:MAG: FkbM family methyltransferase, partial [Actinomycetota bacterium]|nr:FkbM family methyltransferase [Actinomycetota bacterium]
MIRFVGRRNTSRARTRMARALTNVLSVRQLSRLEDGPARRIVRSGTYTIPFGAGHGLRLDAGSLSLSSAQAGGVIRGLHEPQVQEALRRCLPRGGTFVDVGAHVGYLTLIAARLVGPSGSAVAVEPVPANANAIRRNAALNGFANVRVIEAAAAARSGEAELITVADTLWTRLASVGEHPLECRRSSVRTVALDDLLESGELAAVPDVVKIDVEGAEIDVVEGMRGLLARGRTTVICELHGTNERFAAVIDELGMGVTNLDGPEPIAHAGGNDHALAEP